MRGGGAQLTTDLLSEWTDPDTAIEAVGNSLGVFDDAPSAVAVLQSAPPLRAELYDLLLRLVEGGSLDTRACADGRLTFRWSAGLGIVTPDRADGLVAAAHATPPPPADLVLEATPAPEPAPAPARAPAALAEPPGRFWQRLALQSAPLLLPTVSCVLVLLAFVSLDQSIALLIAGAMAVIGVIGVIRRVQLAAFWTVGLVIAGLLLRFS
jgi:hypothetical protein